MAGSRNWVNSQILEKLERATGRVKGQNASLSFPDFLNYSLSFLSAGSALTDSTKLAGKIFLKIPESPKMQNLNLLWAGNYLHSICTALGNAEMIESVKRGCVEVICRYAILYKGPEHPWILVSCGSRKQSPADTNPSPIVSLFSLPQFLLPLMKLLHR